MSRFLLAMVIAAALPLHADPADRVRVIVAVGLPEISTQSSRSMSAGAIGSLRAEVVDALEGATEIEPWGSGPAFSAVVDRAELDRLSRDPRVRAVTIDRGGQGALMDSGPLIGADLVHAQGYDGSGVTVAVLDTGIDAKSPDFAGRISGQRCFCDNLDGSGCCPNGEVTQRGYDAARDDNGHGTHVAGIVAGGGVSAPRGIAPGARIVAVKVLDFNRAFRSFTQIYRALEWIANERPDVKVINMSFGSWSVYTPAECDAVAIAIGMRDLVAELRSRGVLIVASSGNQSSVTGTTLPACMNDILGIGATYDGPANAQASCEQSPAGRDVMTCFTNSSGNIDLVAPGAVITATARGGGFTTMSGTSMAAPHVAGALALMQQVSAGTITSDQAETILKTTGRPIKDTRNGLDFPRLDAAAAVAATPHVAPLPQPKRRGARK
ncbi:MAG: S8 family serine peptidase [Acidobacteriota bacterium]|nr:S8 family serine peptidase [Acidobacteriota bacterium]